MTHLWHHFLGGKLSLSVSATATVLLALVVAPSVAAQTREAGDAELRNVMNVYADAVNKADAQLGSQVLVRIRGRLGNESDRTLARSAAD